MTIKIAINGFGRIGRLSLRAILARLPGEVEVVAHVFAAPQQNLWRGGLAATGSPC